MKTLKDFTDLVNLCLKIAADKYGQMPAVTIRYDLKGRAAGMAGCRRSWDGTATDLYLRFNREALEKDWDHMVKQTIPHEVAHLVAYCFPRLGAKNHNSAWKMIDRSLGGTGERCHQMELTPAKARSRFIYVTASGAEVVVGPKHHKGLQEGRYGYLRNKRTGEMIKREHYQRAA